MNNEELKIKIAAILQSRAFKNGCYKDVEIGYITALNIADALIEAGIGEVSELKKHRVFVEKSPISTNDYYVFSNTPPRIKQLYSGEEVEQIVKERSEYKRRAKVAEKALREACSRAWSIECTCPSIFEDNDECSECYKNQSEKRYEEKDAIGCLSKKLL